MKTLGRLFILLTLLALPFSKGYALDLGYAKEDAGHAGAFLDFAASARSLGMGRAHVAVADDASAVYWNPAGLSHLDRKDIVTMYSVLYENTGFGSFNYAQPTVDFGTFGIGLVNLRSDSYDKRNNVGDKQGTFGTSETGFLLSHGVAVGESFAFGTTLKYIKEQVDSYSDSGYGADFGGLWKWRPNLHLGIAMHNVLAPELKLRNVSDKYPRDIRAGVKYQMSRKLMLVTDVNRTENRSSKISAGGEWSYSPSMALRLGINESEVTAGLGIKIGSLGIDYAFGFQDAVGGVKDLGASHRFGFHYSFGQKASDQEVSLRWQKRGQVYLLDLKSHMNAETFEVTDQLEKAVTGARQVIRHQGFIRPQDLYSAQGYISFFEGEYERSVQSLGEALVLDPQNDELSRHLEKARAQMTEGRTKEIVAFELKRVKELYEKNDWKGTVKSCEKILSFRPDHTEAQVYLEDAKARIMEPILREMKIGKAKFDREEYLDAIKSFQKVKEMDPENKEASQYISHAIASLEKQAQTQANLASLERPVYEITRDTEKSRSLYSQGLLLYSQGKLKEASSVWAQAVKYDDANTLARNAYNRAQIELQEKQP